MAKVKGKKLTYAQRVLLTNEGINDTKDWLFLGMQVLDQFGGKHLSRNDPKDSYMVFENKVTGETKRFKITE